MTTPQAKAFHAVCPPTITAAAIIHGCRLSMDGNQEMAWRALKNLWIECAAPLADLLKRDPMSPLASAALVMEAYFGCDGDWARMERRLTAASSELMPLAIVESLVRTMGKKFAGVAAEMATKESAR